ncbi:S-adenosyl-L-methionine-dependent methyltransferase [Sordaria brevicollis]|uniref:S-adenosyl-L-methionine-dependent methyltransferase n=1 Tax=Sordaria brevicollis TaxID=83679 RepID=A0AAE0UEA5_SORBR|nr:S-adenosyl-L-methionine-dependent methyltransferase [Sordaria brevicollis]
MSSPKEEAVSPSPGPASPGIGTESLLPGTHWGQQELSDSDGDSTLGSDAESSTASITSSILKYRIINGRTYHSESVTDGEYWAPNDEKQNEVLDIFHHYATLLFDGELHTAPITNDPKNVIDIGTGTGLWAIDFADKFPKCNVIGTDISPIQPSWVPPNVTFEIDDYTKEWTFKENTQFDYIHFRWLNGTSKDWAEVYKQAYRYCKPGGWIEHMDTSAACYSDDGSVSEKNAVVQWGKVWQEAGKRIGRPFDLLEQNLMEDGMKAAGFTNIVSKDYAVPVSPWHEDPKQKELGLFFQVLWLEDIEGVIQHTFGNVMGWTQEELKNYAHQLRSELKNPKIHPYTIWRVVYGQKPLDA